MEMQAKAELVGVIRERYVCASRKDKSRILDEFVAVTGHHRKHAVRLLSEPIVNSVSHVIFHDRHDFIGNQEGIDPVLVQVLEFARAVKVKAHAHIELLRLWFPIGVDCL